MDEMTLLRELEDDVAPLSVNAERAARARLREAIGRERRPARVRRSHVAVAVVAAASVAVAATTTFDAGRLPGWVQPASAAPLLQEAASEARAARPLAYRDDQYVYVRTIVEEKGPAGRRRFVNEAWFPGANDRPARIVEHGRTWAEGPYPEGQTWPPRTREELAALPADPEALLVAVMRWFGPSGDDATDRQSATTGLTTLLVRPQASPDLRAAAFAALARIPGVTVEEGLRAAGRPAIGIRVPAAHSTQADELIMMDRDTSEHLATRSRATDRDGRRSEQLITVDEVAVVEDIGDR